ncbi:DUF305 domain-containing protein [Arthrobacter sp. CJ23]|uniref:DUF305 domain-containing protein n=1 Tax=Arthrobacter sp. CJ23 TaxID=2972479 RepID=UPI00215D5C78|nr:DUF305 domain-containing protein [Arthrobacter sp. CJ23]UVJ40206.1 DUF305 domain-containing protein [Arthrobacter sp. CJ23]
MNKKFLTLSATAFAATLALAGCSGGADMPGMDHGTSAARSTGPTQSGSLASGSATTSDHNAADTTFAQSMIPHHAQAVEMSELMLKKQGIPAAVTALATRIKAAQAPEIATMTGWLNAWNEPSDAHSGHSMAGMMGADDLKALDAAQGSEAARLFLNQMIAHHEGALVMARDEIASGQHSGAVDLGKAIVAAQETEIKEMKDILAAL